jgi:hypothetical protein
MMRTEEVKHIGGKIAKLAAALFAVVACGIPAVHADTDWIVLPRASESRKMLLHALRDNSKPVSTDIRLDKGGKIKSLRIGNTKTNFTFGGINYSGVAVLATGGDPQRDKLPKAHKRNYTGSNAVNLILRNCKTAEQGVNLLRDGFRKSLIAGSLIFFVVDAKRAFVVECSPKHFASFELTGSFCVYANMWKLPNMQDASQRLFNSVGWQAQREWAVAEMLRRARQSGGTISLAESFATSRVGVAEINNPAVNKARDRNKKLIKVNNTPAMRTSADGVLFEIDPEFPGVLSCAYVAFGPARHTVYLPIPVGAVEKLPAELTPDPWKAAALARNKSAKPETPINAQIIAFENRMQEEFAKKREAARELLRAQRPAEAKKLLQENLQRQAAELNKFLQSLGH